MPKPNSNTIKTITEYKSANDLASRNRALLASRLTVLYETERRTQEEMRQIETALAAGKPADDSATKEAPKPPKTPGATSKGPKVPARARKKAPSGEISPAIFAFVLKHPGAKSAEIRDKVRIDGKTMVQYAGNLVKAKMTIGTALNAMKKHGYLRVKGTRSNYGYYAVN